MSVKIQWRPFVGVFSVKKFYLTLIFLRMLDNVIEGPLGIVNQSEMFEIVFKMLSFF